MKRQYLIVLATLAALIIGMGSLASVQGSDIVVSIPGKTVVMDAADDLLLRNCDPAHPAIPCSLPPGAPLELPGYFDIKTAQITQIGRGVVDLMINLYQPIPAEPPYGFVSYIWQFAGGCVGPNPLPGDKDAISIVWQDWGSGTWEWRAYWYVITQCEPSRKIERGDSLPFHFTADGIKVRVPLADLLTAVDQTGILKWHAAVRRVPFIYSFGGVNYPNTAAVDYGPDVVEFNPNIPPEEPATWEPR